MKSVQIHFRFLYLLILFLSCSSYISIAEGNELPRAGKYANTYMIKDKTYKCPNGLFYDIDVKACLEFSLKSFLGNDQTAINYSNDTTFSMPTTLCSFSPLEDCTKFSGNGVTYSCPPPLLYNERSCTCDWDYNVPECVNGVRHPKNDTNPIEPPSPPPSSSEYINLVCFVTNWSIYRNARGQFLFLRDIDPNLCSTIVYAFIGVNNGQLIPFDPNADIVRNGFKDVLSLKGKGKVKQILISFPGWSAKIHKGIVETFNKGSQAIEAFAKNSVAFLDKYGFDGIDLDFEMGYNCQHFELYVKHLKANMGKKLLTASLFTAKWSTDNNCSPYIAKYIDYGLVMSYQLQGPETYSSPWSTTDVKKAMDFVHQYLNIPKHKLYLGIAQWSWSLNAQDRKEQVQDLISQRVRYPDSYSYEYTGEALRIGNIEYCILNEKNIRYLTNTKTSYVDNNQNLRRIYMTGLQRQMLEIRNYVINSGYAGGMVWNLDLSDFKNNCQCKKKHQDLYAFAYGLTDENCILW